MINERLVRLLFDKVLRRTGLTTSQLGHGAVSEQAVYYWVEDDFWLAYLKDGVWYDVYVGPDISSFPVLQTWEALPEGGYHQTFPSLRALIENSAEGLVEG